MTILKLIAIFFIGIIKLSVMFPMIFILIPIQLGTGGKVLIDTYLDKVYNYNPIKFNN